MRFSPIPFDEQQEILLRPETISRFFRKVSPEPMSGCWLWLGAAGVHGHGQFFIKGATRKGLIAAHRASWAIHQGHHPAALLVCHKCDNPACVNPDHMFLGTHKDNSIDCVNKGRWGGPEDNKGEMNPAAILTDEAVLFIRRSGLSSTALAEKFGVTRTTVWEAKSGVTWAHLPHANGSTPRRTYTADQIAILNDETITSKTAANLVGCTLTAVYSRRSKLRKGLIVKTKDRRKNASGMSAQVWRAA